MSETIHEYLHNSLNIKLFSSKEQAISCKDQIKSWVRLLRSGRYKQGYEYLNKGDTYCVLGVACRVLGYKRDNAAKVKKNEQIDCNANGFYFGNDYDANCFSYLCLDSEAYCLFGLNDGKGSFESTTQEDENEQANGLVKPLSVLNDAQQWTFEELANLIEARYNLETGEQLICTLS